jgi:hypothetical protein
MYKNNIEEQGHHLRVIEPTTYNIADSGLKCTDGDSKVRNGLGLCRKMPILSNLFINMGRRSGLLSLKTYRVPVDLFRKDWQAVQREMA